MATVLFVLFDETDSLNNVLSLSTVKPDRVYLLGGMKMERRKAQTLFTRCAAEIRADMDVVFIPCLGYDLSMLTETLERLLERHEKDNCILDAVGGESTYLLAAGACLQRHPEMQVLSKHKQKPELIYLSGEKAGQTVPVDCTLSVRQAIAIAGGELLRCGHADWRTLGDKIMKLIPRMFRVYRANRRNWPRFVNYLQQMNRAEYAQGNNTFTAPLSLRTGKGRPMNADTQIFRALREAGALTKLDITGEQITARFYSAQVLKFLCDTGSWLELFLFYILHQYDLADDIELNAVISWEEGDSSATINELDLIAVHGLNQLFISCKSGTPDNAALNEIGTLTRHFGTRYARAVLATASTLRKDAPAVYRRAAEMNVSVLDETLFDDEKAIRDALKELLNESTGTV